MILTDSLLDHAGEMVAIRRDLHAHPELCFQEIRTAALVADKLAEWGIPVHCGLGGTGVVGIVKNGASARAVGLRADMDALPVTERNTFAHASQFPGQMHACGHDGHVTMLLAAARYLACQRNFDGTVYLIFQPAEEGGGGACKMIEDGLFNRFPMDAVFAMHNWPGMKVGQFAVSPGPVMAAANDFEITIHGKGGHAAQPHAGADPVLAGCALVQAFQGILSRNKNPLEPGVLSVTMFHAGDKDNIVPDEARIAGTVRTFSIETLDLIEQRMREMAEHLCAAYGVRCASFQFYRNYPPTINDTVQADFMRAVMTETFGAQNVLPQTPAMTAEDFSFMLQARPGAYAFIGNGDGLHRLSPHGDGPCLLHNASYDFNDELIVPGATLWIRLVERFLAPGPED
ncbi:MAG: amidohydrolase [Burkholderiaceae bacterium]|jgi:hippurate hydrolase|nr:amidohydrolase [Burkholderiaceae bacterium]